MENLIQTQGVRKRIGEAMNRDILDNILFVLRIFGVIVVMGILYYLNPFLGGFVIGVTLGSILLNL